MSTIKSQTEHLTLNADGTGKEIKFQANGVEKASISSTGAFTSTTIDATKLTGNLPAIDGASLTGAGNYVKTHSMTSSTVSTLSTTMTDVTGASITINRGDTTSGNKYIVTFGVATYNDTGDSGHGFQLHRKIGSGSWVNIYEPADGWGIGGYGGPHSDYVTITYADTINATDSVVYYKLKGQKWTSGDIVYINYTGYDKTMTAVVMEVKA